MIRCLFLSLLFLSVPSFASHKIYLGTQDRPPYTWSENNLPAGPFDKVVVCALDKMGINYDIQFLPWSRAQSLTRRGKLDGFYAGSQSEGRDSYAIASRFIGKQNWAYFYLRDGINKPVNDELLKRSRVGAYLGSNMAKWLKEKNIHITYRPISPEMLLEGLLRERVDIVLANEAAMMALIEQTSHSNAIEHQVVVSKPIAVYFGKKYVHEHPGFMSAFNHAASQCLPKNSLVIYAE